MRSRGVSNTECSAKVSSTTPRLGARCPPFSEQVWRISSRISAAISGRRSVGTFLRSCGDWIPSNQDMHNLKRAVGGSPLEGVPCERQSHTQRRADEHLKWRMAEKFEEPALA